jgi:sugar O-acyltransferase (sialic acid O-acetyltransferase NeuD family)
VGPPVNQSLIVLGAGGNLFDLLDVIDALNAIRPTWRVLGVLDDRRDIGSVHAGLTVLGRLKDARTFSECSFVSSIWNENSFRQIDRVIEACGLDISRFVTLVHPQACVSQRAHLGRGVVINFGASIAGNARLGDFVSIGPGCIIGHDSTLEGFTCVAAGAVISGSVQIHKNCYIGSAASVRQHCVIGSRSLVGLGAVVIEDVEPGCVVAGNPARIIRKYEQQALPQES